MPKFVVWKQRYPQLDCPPPRNRVAGLFFSKAARDKKSKLVIATTLRCGSLYLHCWPEVLF